MSGSSDRDDAAADVNPMVSVEGADAKFAQELQDSYDRREQRPSTTGSPVTDEAVLAFADPMFAGWDGEERAINPDSLEGERASERASDNRTAKVRHLEGA